MIRALIVDDEKITRKGMISVIPWERFGIEIVGDIGTAASALTFMEDHPVDLVFVDVAMPGMNGIDLIREMRRRGLECTVVVLTFYDDFEYVREALRLGAVDYVLKTQLDDEKILDMLERVTRTMAEGRQARAAAETPRELFALIGTADDGDAASALIGDLANDPRHVLGVGNGVSLLELDSHEGGSVEAARAAARAGGAVLVRLAGAMAHPREALSAASARIRTLVFYDCTIDEFPCTLSAEQLLAGQSEAPPEEAGLLRRKWLSAHWLLLDEQFRELEELTRRLRLPVRDLVNTILDASSEIAGAFPSLGGAFVDARTAAGFITWSQWRALLDKSRADARERFHDMRHSEEIVRKVLDAVDIIRETDGRYGKEEVVAARVGLSRSYFSHCFKEITGVEFRKFLVDKSIAEAKRLLLLTHEPFRRISARLGYQNEGHFSRMFRAMTGLSPGEFRRAHQAEGNQR